MKNLPFKYKQRDKPKDKNNTNAITQMVLITLFKSTVNKSLKDFPPFATFLSELQSLFHHPFFFSSRQTTSNRGNNGLNDQLPLIEKGERDREKRNEEICFFINKFLTMKKICGICSSNSFESKIISLNNVDS